MREGVEKKTTKMGRRFKRGGSRDEGNMIHREELGKEVRNWKSIPPP